MNYQLYDFVKASELSVIKAIEPENVFFEYTSTDDMAFAHFNNVHLGKQRDSDPHPLSDLDIQALDSSDQDKELGKLFAYIIKGLQARPLDCVDEEFFVRQIENFGIIVNYAKLCRNMVDYYYLAVISYRLFTGKLFSKKIEEMIGQLFSPESEIQSFGMEETIHTLRSFFDGVGEVADCELARKVVKLYSYLLTQGYLEKLNITINDEDYSKIEQRALLSAFSSKKGFVVCVIDTCLFVCERILEFRKTGLITSFIHSGSKYAEWFSEADRIINLAPFTGNLAAHNTSYFSYIADLRDLCERGEAYAKYMKSTSGVESALLLRKLNTLRLLNNTEITRRAAMQERTQPMGVLIHGKSSIAKSAFTKILFNYYGSLFDLEHTDDFRYVRNPMDEYWSNFDTSKWCIQLDDIAFKHPGKTSDIDSTLQDLLNVVNNVPYVPPQAALEDKGKTPVMAELVLATTNCVTLNAHEYFWCPLAVRRRLPFVIQLVPKDEFLHANQAFIDPAKIRIEEGLFPDLWNISVSEIDPVMEGNRERARLKEVATFTNISEFLQFFGKACLKHKENQSRAVSSDVDMRSIKVCKKCLKPLPHEECMEVQSCDSYLNFYFLMYSFLNWIFAYAMVQRILFRFSKIPLLKHMTFALINRVTNESGVIQFYRRYVDYQRKNRLGQICALLGLVSTLVGTYYLYNTHSKRRRDEAFLREVSKCGYDETGECNTTHDFNVQGNMYGTVEEQLLKEEKQNVWYNPTVELTTFDVPPASASSASITIDGMRKLFSRNCVVLQVRLAGETIKRTNRAVFLVGHTCMTNAHAFKSHDWSSEYEIEIIQSNLTNGFNSNLKIHVKARDIVFNASLDLCAFEVPSIPPFKDIMKFWQRKHITPSSCVQFVRQTDGKLETRSVFGLEYFPKLEVPQLNSQFNIHLGHSQYDTENGLCGSLCIAQTPRGPIIFGIHLLGKEKRTGILDIKCDDIIALLPKGGFTSRPVVQSGSVPDMETAERKHVLGPIHHKSIVRYLENGTANVYGSFSGFRPKPRSKVCLTPLSGVIQSHYKRPIIHGQPAMDGWEPWRNNVIEMVKPKVNYDRATLQECVESFTDEIIGALPQDWIYELVILSDMAAVNGLPGVIYIDGLNRNTSMGFPWCKSKSGYLLEAKSERYPDGTTFGPEVWERVRKIEEIYKGGCRYNTIFMGHLKDEAVTLEKQQKKKTRLFTGAPVDWSIVVRKYLLSFVRLVQKNKYVFEAGPGLVCQSSEWGEVYKYLTHFGKDRIVAGDYGKFDKRMTADFILAAYEIIINLYRAAGFPEDELRVLSCIAEDTAFPICNINGDLIEFFGTNPSGHPLTVIINSLVNALYMRYCYAILNPKKVVRNFKENVHLFTYGDDNVFGVSRKADWFNHTAIQEQLAKIGVEYTMADKTSKSVPFINIDDVSFLKRSWRWDEDVQNYTCPLEEDSIFKSLTVWVPSGTVDKYKQMVDVITSANNEYFFYGRKIFDVKHKFLSELVSQEPYCFYLIDGALPSYQELLNRWRRASGLDCSAVSEEENWQSSNLKNKMSQDNINEEVTCGSDKVEEITTSISPREESKGTPCVSNNSLDVQSDDVDESVEMDTFVKHNVEETTSVLTFVDSSSGVSSDTMYMMNPIISGDSTTKTELGEFLKRPVKIDTRSWTTSDVTGDLGSTIEPWFLFLNNSVITNKLRNYAFFRAKLCIKVLLNATPFHFGHLRVVYEPNVDAAGTGNRASKVRTNAVSNLPLVVPYSQLPGGWIYPSENAGCEIHVPFFKSHNWALLTSAADIKTLGTLKYYIAFPLGVASTSGSTVLTLTTYAWLEDVELSASTAELTLQSGDEYDGPISSVASATAKVGNVLSKLPIIGRFARATEIGANALAGIASLFGYTNVPVIEPVHAIMPNNAPHLASCEISTAVQKLTVDPKQEVSIDPSLHGIKSHDELVISNIVMKESALVVDGWSTSDAVDTVIFNANVSPFLNSVVNILDGSSNVVAYRVYHTPMSYVAMMFQHWRGDIIFDIDVICTKFHKGRLKIAWDPLSSSGNTALPDNTVFTTILDIGETNKASVRIPYHAAYAWLRCRGITRENWSPGNSLPINPEFDNGSIIISVLSPLISPVSPQNVGVKISVRGAENLEFANPRSMTENSSYSPPSFFAVQSKDEDSADIQSQMIVFGDDGTSHPNRYALNFGERIVSLRQLLHRYSHYDTVASVKTTSTKFSTFRRSYTLMPRMYGWDPNGLSSANKVLTAGTANFNFTPTHPALYVAMMFGGYRGSMNFITNLSQDLQPYIGHTTIERLTNTVATTFRIGAYSENVNTGASTSSLARNLNNASFTTGLIAGGVLTNTQTNGSLSWQYPFLTGYNFLYPNPETIVAGNSFDGSSRECCLLTSVIKQQTSETSTDLLTVHTYSGTGPDFNCFWFLCCPTLDYYVSIPVAA